MPDYAYPNRIRAYTGLLIYRDAMRPYVAETLEAAYGAEWFDKCLLEPLRKRVGNGDRGAKTALDTKMHGLAQGKEQYQILENADISVLLNDHSKLFQRLRKSDIARMQQIRSLRNEFLEHDLDEGDCGPEVADAITSQCILVLNSCGLPAAAEAVQYLTSSAASAADPQPAAPRKRSRVRQQGTGVCVCGCGGKTKSLFKSGCDGRLRGIVHRDNAEECARVDWARVPETFHNGDYAEDIRRYRNLYSRNSEDRS